jgi:tRNA(Ile2) C34 agmatinyltransferase TiaS
MGGKRSVLFAEKKGNCVLTIKNFDDFILEFHKFIGENIINCNICEKPTKPTGKNQKMCGECWKEYRRAYKTEKQREYRNVVDTLQ